MSNASLGDDIFKLLYFLYEIYYYFYIIIFELKKTSHIKDRH